MNTERLVAFLAMAGAGLGTEIGGAPTHQPTVTVCMDTESVLMGVRALASKMFETIGVRIDWREMDKCPSGKRAVQVRMAHDSKSMRGSSAEALAFALPYRGTVVVFPDRVEGLNRGRVRFLMAHVLVHEITHVLERVDRHSSTGVMKAKWSDRELSDMQKKPIPFAQEDVDLILAALRPLDPVKGSLASQ